MTTGQLIRRLQAEGIKATKARLYYALVCKRLSEPAVDDVGNYRWSKHHLAEFRAYLANPPKRGRPKRKEG